MLNDMMGVKDTLDLYDAMIEGALGNGDRDIALCRHDAALERELQQVKSDYITLWLAVEMLAAGLRWALPKLGTLTLDEIGERDRYRSLLACTDGLGEKLMAEIPKYERRIRQNAAH